MPVGVDAVVQNVRVMVAEEPDARVTEVELRVTVGPDGITVVLRPIVPENPLMLVRVTEDVAHMPGVIEMFDGDALIVKSGAGLLLLNVAD